MKQVWHSSYEQNNYGDLFYSLIRLYQPEKVVELGTKAGYSAYHIAKGLKANGHGTLNCYDLWEDFLESYGFDTIPKSVAEKNLEEFKEIITLKLADAFGIDKKYQQVDILHVDIENNGEILEKVIPAWIDKVRQIIIIEGGSRERDQADIPSDYKKMPVTDWLKDFKGHQARVLKKMVKTPTKTNQYVVVGGYKDQQKPIAKWLKSYSNRRQDIEYLTIEPFPSVTIIRKK